MQPRIPRGLRDVLPTEAAERRLLAERCRAAFESWGYGEIATPAFEYFDLLALETGEEISREMFRFVDSDGRLVALRPEMTTPIARAVAQRLRFEPTPLRLFYVQDVFREQPARLGEQRQFEQAGVELLGAKGPAADMEIVALAAEMLSSAGLAEFQIGVGHVGLFRIVLEQLGVDAERGRRAEELATARNLVGLGSLLGEVSARAREGVMALVKTRGGREAIEAARGGVRTVEGRAVLEELAETYRLLESYGLDSKVMLDFGIIRNFDYYTGLVLEAYAPDLGAPVATGGRYDGLLGEFGAPMPAAGFAAGLERLHLAVSKQDGEEPGPEGPVLVGWEEEPVRALAVAKKLREAGQAASVVLQATSPAGLGRELVTRGCRLGVFLAADGTLLLTEGNGERPVSGPDEILKELDK